MEWFETLALFGYDTELGEMRKDNDVNLVPRVVEKALVPKLQRKISVAVESSLLSSIDQLS